MGTASLLDDVVLNIETLNRAATEPSVVEAITGIDELIMEIQKNLDFIDELAFETEPSRTTHEPCMETSLVSDEASSETTNIHSDELSMETANDEIVDEPNPAAPETDSVTDFDFDWETEPSLATDEPCMESLDSDETSSETSSIHIDEPSLETTNGQIVDEPKAAATETDSPTDCDQKYSLHIPRSDATCPTELLTDIYSVLHRNTQDIAELKADADWLTPRQRWVLKECELLTQSLLQHLDTQHYMDDEPDYWASSDYLRFWQIELIDDGVLQNKFLDVLVNIRWATRDLCLLQVMLQWLIH